VPISKIKILLRREIEQHNPGLLNLKISGAAMPGEAAAPNTAPTPARLDRYFSPHGALDIERI